MTTPGTPFQSNAALGIFLDRTVALTDVINAEALTRICGVFAKLMGASVAIYDHTHQQIAASHLADEACAKVANKSASTFSCLWDVPGQYFSPADSLLFLSEPSPAICTCGGVFTVLPVQYQAFVQGYALVGPFSAPATRSIDAMAAALRDVLAVVVETGYAQYLASQIHVATIQQAYDDLNEKNRRLADSVERLKQLDQVKMNFLATVSHELRTPLTSIIGYAEMLHDEVSGPLSAEQHDQVQIISEKGHQLLLLISELLDMSRIEAGKLELTLEPVQLNDVMQQACASMMPQSRRKKIKLNCHQDKTLPTVMADVAKLRQVLLNLLSNALKFTPSGGVIDVQAQCNPDGIRLTVADSGVGIAPENRERIFEPFVQLSHAATRDQGGTGLGLAIVRRFVEAHGGRVWVESPQTSNTSGSTFVVTLPRT